MVKFHDKFGFFYAFFAHFLTKRDNALQPTRLALHTQYSRKTDNRFCF